MSKLPIVAIIGRPNVGKSSLFNRLSGERRAIVADQAGTTRDMVQYTVSHQGKNFWLIDTAGLQKTSDQILSSALEQADEAIASADLIVQVVDASSALTQEDKEIARRAHKAKKDLILAVNKIDASANKVPVTAKKLGIKAVYGLSAIHGNGAMELLDAIADTLPKRKAVENSEFNLALVGRPNVGKSSIFNALTGSPKAVVSDTPGTTRDVNIAKIKYHGEDFRLQDTGGIRRRGKIKDIEFFSWLRTAQAINESDVVVLVIDATEPSVALDQKIAGLIKEAGKGLIIAINKWDLVKHEEGKQAWLERLLQHDFPFVWWAPLVLTSAENGHNIKKLLQLARDIIERRQQKFPTRELNKIVQTAMAAHPPSGLKNRHPKLNYATQTGLNPPEFTLFGANISFLHWSYKRYLESQLREAYDFSGTPITLLFKSKYKDER